MTEKKYIDVKEFHEKGYLQEANRRFFHPLGLALSIKYNEDESCILGEIWDSRDDEEGFYFDIKNGDDERKERFKKNKDFIDQELIKFKKYRTDNLGFDIEPIE